MNLKVNNITFRGPLDGFATSILRVCDTNEVVNAVGLDIGAMVVPRTYYDAKARNKYAGAETFFREISGTFINCLSAGLLAQLISKIASKKIMPETYMNSKSWYTKDSLVTLNAAWEKSASIKEYVNNVLENLHGKDGYNVVNYRDIDWQNIDWIDEYDWEHISWKNSKYKGIQSRLKTKDGIQKAILDIIETKDIDKTDRKNMMTIIEKRITNALKAERSTSLEIGENKLEAELGNILRDTVDMGRDIFNNKGINIQKALEKIGKVNKIKAFGAIAGACFLGLTNQYINRKITEKRTGKKGFVGDVDFTSDSRTEQKKDKFLLLKKLGASAAMIGMVLSVMRVKNLKDFARKLEFAGPITSGNAIKTVYASNIVGRFLAADNGTELRESMTRDYLGFLNWLVLGGFAAKGVANILDTRKNIFNFAKKGEGIRHWLNDMSLKTHNEIASKGKDFAKKNMWKLNAAYASGILYSAITLGILLPMLNKKVTEYRHKKSSQL